MGYYVGIDVGGTFTDICVADQKGDVSIFKCQSTPDIATGVLDGLKVAADSQGLDLSGFLGRIERFGHGSTIAVNTLLQRRGAKIGLITTRGFADTLWIARMMAMTTGLSPEKWTHYRLRQRPDPLVERALVCEVDERVDFRGEVVVPLQVEAAQQALKELLDNGIEALAICTLWSFRNPLHERMLADMAREMAPHLYISVSSDLVPLIKEYERMATTVVNGYLGPAVDDYLGLMESQLKTSGFRKDFFMLNSVGGVIPPDEAAKKPIQLMGSGPSGGVLAARMLSMEMGQDKIVTADMGGTSFDVGLIVDGEPLMDSEVAVGNLNLLNPMLSVRSIGCGGGSIASVRDGMLKVGPESAGSSPGPACYGRGGTDATITDADLVLGFLNPDYFLGGKISVDTEAASEAIRRHVAEPLGLSVADAAAGIREVADQQMADLLRQSTLERGHDPRDFWLCAYGGAGPVHICAIGTQARVRSILIPRMASVFSAQGILEADMRLSQQQSVLQRTLGNRSNRAEGLDGSSLEAIFVELEKGATEAFQKYKTGDEDDRYFLRSVSMRFARQVHEIRVPVHGSMAEPGATERLLRSFDSIYEKRYGRGTGSMSAIVEITNCQVQLVQVLPKAKQKPEGPKNPLNPSSSRKVYRKDWVKVPVYLWDMLPHGSRFSGPALVDAPNTTVWIGETYIAKVDGMGNILLEEKE